MFFFLGYYSVAISPHVFADANMFSVALLARSGDRSALLGRSYGHIQPPAPASRVILQLFKKLPLHVCTTCLCSCRSLKSTSS